MVRLDGRRPDLAQGDLGGAAQLDAEQAPALHLRFLNQRSELPIHHSWADWLWRHGLQNEAIRTLKSVGLNAWACYHDPQLLETELSAAIKYGALKAPRELNGGSA